MAISYIGGNSATGTDDAPTITHGLTIEAGDVLIATIGVDTNAITLLDDNGANPFVEDWNGAPGTHTFRQYVGSRVAGASEPPTYDWSLDNPEGWNLMIQQFRGVDNADIYDVAPSATTEADGSSATATTPAMTTSVDGAEGICLFSADSGSVNWSAYTNSYTDELEPGGGLVSAVVRRNFASSGVQPAVSATVSLSRNWGCHQFSLKPASDFPIVVSITESQITNGATLVVDNPASGIVSGDLLLHIACCDGSGDTISYPAGDLTDNELANVNVGVFGILITYEIADGSENGGSNTLTLSASLENINAFVLHIQNWHGTTPPELARVASNGANPDPPNLDPTGWGTEDTLWIAGQLQDEDANTVSVWPYPDNRTLTANAQSQIAFCSDELATASQDPSAFTMSVSTDREAFTIAVRPAADGAPPPTPPFYHRRHVGFVSG